MKSGMRLLILKNLMYVNYIPIYFVFIVFNIKKNYIFIVKKLIKYRIKKIIKISKFQKLILIKRKKKIIIKIKKTLKKTPN